MASCRRISSVIASLYDSCSFTNAASFSAPRSGWVLFASNLNNLAYVHGMRPVYQYGAFVGTVGEYTTNALDLETSLDADEFPEGGSR